MRPPSIDHPLLAAGSFLDLDARGFVDVALANDDCAGIGLRVTGDLAGRISPGLARDVAARLAAGGRMVHDVEVIRLGAADESNLGSVADTVAIAGDLGARFVLAVSDLPDLASSIDGFGRLRAIAHDRGVEIAVEYMAWTQPSTPSDAIRVHESTGCPIVVDLLHHTRVGASADDLIRLGSAIGWVQICDAAPEIPNGEHELVREARHGRLVPGDGVLPIGEYLAALPHDVAVSIEVQSDELLRLGAADRARRLIAATRVFAS